MKKYIPHLLGAAFIAALLAVPLLSDNPVRDSWSQVDIPDVSLETSVLVDSYSANEIDHPGPATHTVAVTEIDIPAHTEYLNTSSGVGRVVHYPSVISAIGTSIDHGIAVAYTPAEIDHPDPQVFVSAQSPATEVPSRTILRI